MVGTRYVVALVVTMAVAGCFNDGGTRCGDLLCPSPKVCSAGNACVLSQQVTACDGLASGATCAFDQSVGFCNGQACVTDLAMCGDGVTSPGLGEFCDCGDPQFLNAPPTGCATFNSNAPGATCRVGCRLARCGDGIVDPDELCDDGNNISGDGCRSDCQGRFDKMQPPVAFNLLGGWMNGPNDVYDVAPYILLHYDGTMWSATTISAAGLSSVWASGPKDVYLLDTPSTLLHYDGVTLKTALTASMIGPGNVSIGRVWGSGPADVYVTGTTMGPSVWTPFLYHYDGVTWSPVALPAACTSGGSVFATALWGISGEVFLGTNVGICHRSTMGVWSLFDTTPADSFAGDATHLYSLTGATGLAIYMLPSAVPTPVSIPGYVSAFTTTSPDEILAVGAYGVVLQYRVSTQTWTRLATPTEAQLTTIVATGPNDVFIFGDGGTILH